MNYVNNIIEHLSHGNPMYILQGEINDLTTQSDGIIKVEELLSECLAQNLNLQLVKFCPATGTELISNSKYGTQPNDLLREVGFYNSSEGLREGFNNILKGLFQLSKMVPRRNIPYRICCLIEFSHHLIPNVQPGFHTDEQLVAIELLHKLMTSNDILQSGNIVLINTDESLQELEKLQLPKIANKNLNTEEKEEFINVCLTRYPDAAIENEIDEQTFVRLSQNTSNRTTYNLIRGSHNSKNAITLEKIREQRELDILSMSEGLLGPSNPNRLQNPLVGKHTDVVIEKLTQLSKALKKGKRATPANVLLVGPKSTGKSDMLEWLAKLTKVPAFKMHSPKSMWVGESERKVRKLFTIMNRFKPALFMCDEIDLQFKLDRNQQNFDSGTTDNIIGVFQDNLADSSRRGSNIIIGTSNEPNWGASMAERWEFIPVLSPHPDDYPLIIKTCINAINEIEIDKNDPDLQEAARLLYFKRHTPRMIIQSLSRLELYNDIKLKPGTILEYAKNANPDVYFNSRLYAEFKARLLCSDPEYLPENNIENYSFPDYYDEVMGDNGEVDLALLDKKVNELESHAKI